LDLGLLQREFAAQTGVNKDTIHNWEKQRTVPEIRFVPKIIQFLGYAPYRQANSLGEGLRVQRTVLGLSQHEAARQIGIDPGTLNGWENARQRPSRRSEEILHPFLSAPIGS
jgi:DNA-binding XRE family transcriptional regulator